MTLNSQNRSFSDFLQFLAAEYRTVTKWMKIDQDYLRTGTAIGSRASHEQQISCLLRFPDCV